MAYGSLRIRRRFIERWQQTIVGALLAFTLVAGTLIPILTNQKQAEAAPNPSITGLFQNSGSTSGGNTITITGTNFGGGKTFNQIAEGGSHSCGVSNGTAYCWGLNTNGQLGNNSTTLSNIPVPVSTAGALSGKTVTMVTAGASHSCAITTEVKAYCWGLNTNGQLGNNSTSQSLVPVAVTATGVLNGKTINDISASAAFTCAMATDGKAYCWGLGSSGQLGDNTGTQSLVPVAVLTSGVLNGKTAVDLATGDTHACVAASDGAAYCWGANGSGQLGNNSTTASNAPVAVTASGALSGKTVTQITGGGTHTCATASGAAYCWGNNANNQLGNNSTTASSVPVAVTATGVLSGKTVTQMTAGSAHTCATASGAAYCWGLNTDGRLGDNSTTQRATAVAVSTTAGNGVLNGKTVTSTFTGSSQTCVLTNDNTSACWGLGTSGQLGNGASASSSSAVMVSMGSLPGPVPTVSFGGTVSTSVVYLSPFALSVYVPARAAGTVSVSITNPDGTTGTLASAYTYISTAPSLAGSLTKSGNAFGGNRFKLSGSNLGTFSTNQITTGYSHTCVLSATNKIFCSGLNSSGQLGDGTTTDKNTPIAVDTSGALSGKTVKQISAGATNTCALDTAGAAYCWGANSLGQVGDNTTTQRNVPTAVSGGLFFSSISVGNSHICAVTTDSKLYCWGNNNDGKIGDNTTTQRNVPTAAITTGVMSGKPIATVSAGWGHTCATTIEGKAYCWGLNTYGAVGNSTSNNSVTSPASVTPNGVLNGKSITKITAGYYHTCAIDSAGVSYCWGLNANGRLGDNTTTQRADPVAVYTTAGPLNGKKVAQISAGGEHTCAVTTDNNVSCWGNNAEGRVGDGTTTQRLIPTAIVTTGVLNGKVENSISVGQYHSCTTTSETYLYCWGLDTNGQLGDGTNTSSSVAVEQAVVQPTATIGPNAARFVYALGKTAVALSAPGPSFLGANNVTVTNADGQNAVLSGGYSYFGDDAAPTINNVSPNTGTTSGGTSVTVNGTNLVNNLNLVGVTVGTEYGNPTGHSCSLTNTGGIYCWGLNNKGQAGNALATAYATPTPLDNYGYVPHYSQVDAGANFTCGLNYDFSVYCWGWNAFGQLGIGGAATDANQQPLAVVKNGAIGNRDIIQVSLGSTHACALAVDNTAYCWGENGDGKLGNSSTTASTSPVAVAGGLKFQSISAGPDQTCAVTIDYKPYCWGRGTDGQLGTTTAANSTTPVAVNTSGVLAGKRIVQMSTLSKASCALDTAGAVYCWGANDSGQLGNGTTTASTTAVAATMSGQTATSINGGINYSCMTTTNGIPRCWGDNISGQQGTGNTTTNTSPTAVVMSGALSGKFVTDFATGERHSCMLSSDGSIACVGVNTHGQLGNALATGDVTSPTLSRDYALPTSVTFDTGAAGNVTRQDATNLTMITPSHATGAVDVKINRADYQTATLTSGYTYAPPATAPNPPTGLNTTPGNSAVVLNWTAPSNNGGASITDYKVEYSSDSGSTWTTFAHSASATATQTVTGLSIGTTYTFRVSAINSAGTSSPSSTATGTPIYITASASSNVAINVIPSAGTKLSSNYQDVTVTTNAPGGYTLGLSTNSTSQNLSSSSYSILPSTGTLASPTLSLTANTWGYRVDGIGGFGAGTTTAETNVNSSTYKWAGVKSNSSSDTIRSQTSPVSNDSVRVWYAVSADTSKPSGSYTGTVLYTAVSN